MKICFITTVSVTIKSFVLQQMKYIKQKHSDWEISCICDFDDSLYEICDEINYIPVSIKRGISLSGIKTIISLIGIFKKQKFDMVVYATPNAAFYASIASFLAKIKKRLYCQWGIRYVGFTGVKRKIFKFLEKITCKLSTDINSVSPLNRKFSINEHLYSENKSEVIGKGGTIGVDLDVYDISKYELYRNDKRAEFNFSKDEFVFGFVGRISKDKGAKELFEALRLFGDDAKVKLLCIGPEEFDEDEIPTELLMWAKSSDRVVLTGYKANEELKEYYTAIDVLVHPTYREGFGMVLQEAGAMGCPIITTNIPGASEVFENQISCILAESKNTQALFDCMQCLYNDKELCEKLGSNARLAVEKNYERSLMLKNQLARYEKLLGVN